ncbi:MAG: hypothetical protein HND47_16055 [Chloroflexi bacterium]|nr:hypothetical protein [Chloroflexota bacterium]
MSIHDLPSRLAGLVASYSLNIQKGEMIAMQASTEAVPLVWVCLYILGVGIMTIVQ